ncbi:MAG: biopolymer transporter ExbD [Deltaproteobacteria bacterium]|nr:biopolymer transporter ExbD [Deltaproteobacteria bacterium]MDQ3299957.1 biopolymer transporter ExbD [Myxococcota bacterium]
MTAKAGRVRRLPLKKPHVDSVKTDINVTPLVDVMLVLLIIFMLMTLVMGRGHDVKLPGARNYSQEKDKMQPVVTVEADGTLYVEKNKLGPVNESTLKEMQNQVEAAWKAPKNPDGVGRIYLKAADTAEYSVVYPVLEYMNKQMAMSNVDLAITKAEDE